MDVRQTVFLYYLNNHFSVVGAATVNKNILSLPLDQTGTSQPPYENMTSPGLAPAVAQSIPVAVKQIKSDFIGIRS